MLPVGKTNSSRVLVILNVGHFLFVTSAKLGRDAGRLHHVVLEHLKPLLWNDRRNAQTLAWMVTGLLQTASVNLSDWTSLVSSKAKFAQSSERRFARWLENQAIEPTMLYGPLITQALRHWGKQRLVLALDTSLLFEQFCLIRVAVL